VNSYKQLVQQSWIEYFALSCNTADRSISDFEKLLTKHISKYYNDIVSNQMFQKALSEFEQFYKVFNSQKISVSFPYMIEELLQKNPLHTRIMYANHYVTTIVADYQGQPFPEFEFTKGNEYSYTSVILTEVLDSKIIHFEFITNNRYEQFMKSGMLNEYVNQSKNNKENVIAYILQLKNEKLI